MGIDAGAGAAANAHSNARRGLTLTLTVVTLALASCGGGTPASDVGPPVTEETNMAAAELPEIATIGGAQDVWPFPFGLDAGRERVESALGPPAAEESRPAGGNDSTALIVTWDYPDFSFTFFADEASDTEQLLSARVKSSGVGLRGGIEIDMKTDDALALLGEPGFRSHDRAVFFYYSSTIELVLRDGRVSEIALSRAMP